ncbi:hypothetical protein D3C84_809780 [compost metagenome]
MRANERRYGASKLLEIRCNLGHTNVNVAVHNLAMSREEIVVCIIEVWAHVTGIQKLTVQLECPLVVRTYQFRNLALIFCADL